MKCKEICSMISDYLDGELNEEVLENMNDHIQDCTECSIKLEQLRKSLDILKLYRDKEPPRDFIGFSIF